MKNLFALTILRIINLQFESQIEDAVIKIKEKVKCVDNTL